MPFKNCLQETTPVSRKNDTRTRTAMQEIFSDQLLYGYCHTAVNFQSEHLL